MSQYTTRQVIWAFILAFEVTHDVILALALVPLLAGAFARY
jgi:hypothetical protein